MRKINIADNTAATMVGLVSVLIWGSSLPVSKFLMTHLGMLAVMGGLYAFCGLLGLCWFGWKKSGVVPPSGKTAAGNSLFYGRWVCFVAHVLLIFTANALVDSRHIALVILLNYFWPTAIILFSVLWTDVRITRIFPFVAGLVIVLFSLGWELVGQGLSRDFFSSRTDVLAYALAFIGSIFWASYSVLSRKGGLDAGGSAVIPYFQLTLGLVLPFSFLPGMASWQSVTVPVALIFAAYCLLQFTAFLCWDYGMRRGSVVFLSLCADFMPWISLFVAFLLLGSRIDGSTVFSAALLVLGAMATRYGTMTRKTVPVAHTQGEAAG